MSEEAKEVTSVGSLQTQLESLKSDVESASQRLALTKARVELNMRRVDELKAEAVRVANWNTPHLGLELALLTGLPSRYTCQRSVT